MVVLGCHRHHRPFLINVSVIILILYVHGEIAEFIAYLQELLDSLEMYAFYSLLVYIFYTVFKKEEEDALEACGAPSDVCLATS